MRFFLNQNAGGHEIEEREDKKSPFQFHQRLPGYAATPLLDAPQLAQELGIKQLLLKDESSRLGLPAFKILGASWAIYRVLQERNGCSFEPWQTLDELIQRLVPLRPLTLVTATDDNHGRAVAHVAALFGLDAKI
ncbi:MAG: pyridoxal-phosphate dependent enzyme, partial [Chthoniobacterales bacterium]